MIQFPGSTYELADVWTDHGCFPYKTLVPAYKRWSANPIEWKIFYHLSNTKLNEVVSNRHSRITCGAKIRKRLQSHKPDVIVSVHPAMNHLPLKSTQKTSKAIGKHIPFFTVVTDLGSAHCMWFERHVDKLYVASDRLYKLARRRGGTPEDKIVMTGLPIRHGFAVQNEKLGGDRTSERGIEYQKKVREELGIAPNKQMVLVMGGGEGVGSLSDIVNNLYAELSTKGVDATICVVCGRNEKLQSELLTRDFDVVTEEILVKAEKNKKGIRGLLGKIRGNNRKETDGSSDVDQIPKGVVDVMPLGFLTNIPEYMVAADVLVSKAGPGTIAEAAAVGLPVMMTRYVCLLFLCFCFEQTILCSFIFFLLLLLASLQFPSRARSRERRCRIGTRFRGIQQKAFENWRNRHVVVARQVAFRNYESESNGSGQSVCGGRNCRGYWTANRCMDEPQ